MPYFATINVRTVLRLVSILASRAYGSISIVCGVGGIPPRLAHARTAETRPFLLFGPGNEARFAQARPNYLCSQYSSPDKVSFNFFLTVFRHKDSNILVSSILENAEHCGGEPEQAVNGFDIGFVTSKIVCQVFIRDS